MKEPIRVVNWKLLRDLKLEAIALFPTLAEHAEDIAQEALVKAKKAIGEWSPSKAYLKRAVQSAGVDMIRYREQHDREIPVDFQALEAYDDPDEDVWEVKDLYYKRDDEPLNDDEYCDGDPLDLVDFLAMGFDVFEVPKTLGDTEREVLRLLTREVVRPEAKEKEPLPSLEAILEAFTERDRALLENYLCDGMSLRALAAKYGLSKSTLQRRLKTLEKAYSGKERDTLTKPSRQKKKSKKKRVSGTRSVMVVRQPPLSA
jgi:RNA polymerase sigma factor (sigma-70 family)